MLQNNTFLIHFTHSCPDLVRKYHFSVVFVQAIITMFVVTNFFLATLMDPGVIPKGKNIVFYDSSEV